ncbi:hypothetical protein GCM10010873_35320 [Cypionkella aquatica]|uniref:BBC1/AIM3 cysteine proteinase-fold domain-containing protein n=1 Tax=Cypionkella aquatica TaxID=1756042 RepID=A0AA37TVW9_9RHOB|nr:hypothetical protein [Cypionkella aquatica]GLS88558.1 hypothetical protein GCM10010873_35320 [Cypionkella aquatica]
MPYTPATAVAFAQRQTGRYGDGECWTLVEAAITGAGGKSSIPQTPKFGPNVAYVWGDVVEVPQLRAGDVVQYQNYVWTQTTRIDVSSPEGTSFSENSRTEGRGLPHHSGLVVRVVSTGIVEVVEQNIPPRSGPVQTVQLVLSAPPASTVRETSGATVTVTTTTHSVSGAVRCYRPIAVA